MPIWAQLVSTWTRSIHNPILWGWWADTSLGSCCHHNYNNFYSWNREHESFILSGNIFHYFFIVAYFLKREKKPQRLIVFSVAIEKWRIRHKFCLFFLLLSLFQKPSFQWPHFKALKVLLVVVVVVADAVIVVVVVVVVIVLLLRLLCKIRQDDLISAKVVELYLLWKEGEKS